MGLLYALAFLWWWIRLVMAVLLMTGSLWLAVRIWRRGAGPLPLGHRNGTARLTAVTVGLMAPVPLIWMLFTPPVIHTDPRHVSQTEAMRQEQKAQWRGSAAHKQRHETRTKEKALKND